MRAIALRRPERGFTLVELVISIAVLALALVFVAQGVQRGGENANSALWQSKTVALAQLLMEELQGRRYDEKTALDAPCGAPPPASVPPCSPSLGPEEASRSLYDDADDLHGFDTRSGDSLEDILETDLEDAARRYAGFEVRVEVSYLGDQFGRDLRDIKQQTLYIFPPAGSTSVAFSSLRGNY